MKGIPVRTKPRNQSLVILICRRRELYRIRIVGAILSKIVEFGILTGVSHFKTTRIMLQVWLYWVLP
jgi:hypothetical protein